jgi:hypothetical protein
MSWSPNTARTLRASAGVAALLLAGLSAQARINVDTVPARDSVQLTIYNSVDLTLVRETRYLTFRKGLNHLEFSWANTLIDPTSVEFKALDHANQVDVLDVSFPPRVTNLLEWRINSELAGEVKVEIRYFTSGISWSADYVAEATKDEKLASLAGYVRVSNRSGEDYENSQIRLVVGVIKLVEDIARLARMAELQTNKDDFAVKELPALAGKRVRRLQESEMSASLGLVMDKRAEIAKQEMSDYFLYTVEGRDTIPNGWSKRLPSFAAKEIPLASYYKFEMERWGNGVMRYYRFKNDKPSKLGDEPLPDGQVKAFREVTDDNLAAFVGQTGVKYVPVNELVELELGRDQEILVKPVMTDWRKENIKFDAKGQAIGWTETQDWRIDTQNSKEINITLDIRRNFPGDWTLATAAPFEKVDATKVKFLFDLKPREKRSIEYELVIQHGANAKR